MEVHKPKPWHGLREFLKEYLIIVVGVLTALAGEQTVEWLHWREVVAGTREALNRELGFDLGVIQTRIDQAPCMARRLSDLQSAFELHAAGHPIRLRRPFGLPEIPQLRTAVWESAAADQSASHMPPALKLRYAAVYEGIYWLRERETEERTAWSYLDEIDDQSILTDRDWAALHQWRAHAKALAQKVDDGILPYDRGGLSSELFLDRAAGLGVTVQPFAQTGGQERIHARIENLCQPLL